MGQDDALQYAENPILFANFLFCLLPLKMRNFFNIFN